MGHNNVAHHADDSRSKRQQILDAAYEVFSRKGYNRATVDEIIALADTGKGTVYNYFVNKEQLFYTLIQERNHPFEKALIKVAESENPTMGKLETMVKMFLQFYLENADLYRVLMHEIRGLSSDVLSTVKPELREKYREDFTRSIGMLGKVFKEGVDQGLFRDIDTNKASFSLFSVIVTFAFQKFVDEDINATAHLITDVFLNGITQR